MAIFILILYKSGMWLRNWITNKGRWEEDKKGESMQESEEREE